MCLNRDVNNTEGADHHRVPDLRLPISPWSKILNQVSKSKLGRTTSINLNKYWSKFGELMTSPSKAKAIKKGSGGLGAKKQLVFGDDDLRKAQAPQIIEESKQQAAIVGRYEIMSSNHAEIDENLANEIKEMWSFQDATLICQVCKAC